MRLIKGERDDTPVYDEPSYRREPPSLAMAICVYGGILLFLVLFWGFVFDGFIIFR